ncbi:hypothetical protein PanWU01x14_172900 [Parasponia andersonii]|uniref:Uncharacterized protein n=1 Tax=Parasponia andersonii TaxID=3476 RepID=A0A2P5C921_PARAD|nr:hypothetical protein PanWU01x14_172900 [Parasponia andersonii]
MRTIISSPYSSIDVLGLGGSVGVLKDSAIWEDVGRRMAAPLGGVPARLGRKGHSIVPLGGVVVSPPLPSGSPVLLGVAVVP